MSETTDPVRDALARYSAAAHDKDVNAFVSLYADDLHVFDMWNTWELRGIGAWRSMAEVWFRSLGDERVVVTASGITSTVSGDLALGHATLTFTAVSAEGKELRSLDNRISVALFAGRNERLIFEALNEETDFEYTPWQFAGMTKDGSWGKMRLTWGSEADSAELNRLFDTMQQFAARHDLPAFIGEFGVTDKKEMASRVRWMTAVAQAALSRKMVPGIWDTGGDRSRNPPHAPSPVLREVLQDLSGSAAPEAR